MPTNYRILGLLTWIINIYLVNGQNLIVNPGAELDPLTNGWSEGVVTAPTNGFHWTRSNAGFGEVAPHGGTYHFYAGDNSNGNYYLYQDVDVSAYAAQIDAGTCPFTFSFWTRMYNYSGITPNDAARAIVEYRDGVGTVLSTYDSGWRTQLFWTQYTDTRTAPVNTRTIRIRLQSNRSSGTAADGYFDDLSLTTPVTLPVSLVNFTAVPVNNFISISWQTSQEIDNAFFILQKSADGEHWENTSKQDGAFKSNTIRNYSFIDQNPLKGNNYYRLVQTDVNGNITASKIISCSFHKTETLIYPNPCSINQPLIILTEENSQLQVYSSEGKMIFSGEADEFDNKELEPGIYNFVLWNNSNFHSESVIIK